MKITTLALVALVAFASAGQTNAQSTETLEIAEVGRSPRWTVVGRTASVIDVKGKKALNLTDGPGTGMAWLTGYDFANGTIDVDMLGHSQPVGRSFVGVAFRVVDAMTHDVVYFRPFNFRATDAGRHDHAVQYMSHPQWPWQKLRAEHPGKYESATRPEPDGDEWFHVRIVVERPKVSVYLNDASTPCLVVDELSARDHGSLGLWVGEGSEGYFANLRVTKKP
ncbi:MAG: hypothetical protein NVS9B3_12400 [Gemmatimonadaceae bacterium]